MNASDLFDLSGRVAIITGGAGMLGLQHAAAIAEAGGHVVLADCLRRDRTPGGVAGRRRHGVDALGVQVDITDKDDVEAMAQHVVKVFGRIDILINNAALTVKGGGARARGLLRAVRGLSARTLERGAAGEPDRRVSVLPGGRTGDGRAAVRRRFSISRRTSAPSAPITASTKASSARTRASRSIRPSSYATTKAGLINFTQLPGDLLGARAVSASIAFRPAASTPATILSSSRT